MGASEEATQFALVEQRLDVAFLRSGAKFNPGLDVWRWVDGPFELHIDFRTLPQRFALHRDALKRCLAVFAKGYSSPYVNNLFRVFLYFAKTNADDSGPCLAISTQELSNFAARLAPHEEWRVGTLNVLLQKWFLLGLPGVDEACVQHLRERRKPGNRKGGAVRTNDPEQGPFTASEYVHLYKAIDTAYGRGDLPMWAFVLTRLLLACGGRISQYTSLKIEDFKVTTHPDGRQAFVLHLPQAKTGHAHVRESFIVFDLSPQTGRLLLDYRAELEAKGYASPSALFPADLIYRRTPSFQRSKGDLFAGHCTSAGLKQRFRETVEPFAPETERLDFTPMPLGPRRFRYTFGTRMAEEGCSKAVIAERLGHVDLQNVDVYFEASPAIVENIDRAMDAFLAPVAQAFRGRLVESEEQATFKGAPGARIIDFRTSTSGIGSCGQGGGCSFNKPVACYTCFKFEPWLDAPHEKILQRLLEERNRYANDTRIAEVNDLAITAVREVIEECRQVREQRENGSAQ